MIARQELVTPFNVNDIKKNTNHCFSFSIITSQTSNILFYLTHN